MSIELTPEVESALASAAQRQGTTPDLLAEAYLRERLHISVLEEIEPAGRSLADYLAGYVGVLGTGNGDESNFAEDTGRRFTEALGRRTAERS